MAKVYKRAETPYYWCWFWFDGKRVRKSTNTPDKRTAEKVALKLEREYHGEEESKKKLLTLSKAIELTQEYVAELSKAGKRSKDTLEFHKKKHRVLLRILGDGLLVSSIGPVQVDSFISARRKEGVKEHTIHKELVALRVVLKTLMRKGVFNGSIDRIIPEFSTDYKAKTRALTPKELETILERAKPERKAWIAFAVATGARLSEIERVRRQDIQLQATGGFLVGLRGTKTDKTNRDGSEITRWVPVVREWQIKLLKLALTHGEPGDRLVQHWPNPANAMLHIVSEGRRKEREAIPPFSPNDLRRTFATWLRAEGTELSLIAASMGHKSSTMVERVYGRLSPQQLLERMRKSQDSISLSPG